MEKNEKMRFAYRSQVFFVFSPNFNVFLGPYIKQTCMFVFLILRGMTQIIRHSSVILLKNLNSQCFSFIRQILLSTVYQVTMNQWINSFLKNSVVCTWTHRPQRFHEVRCISKLTINKYLNSKDSLGKHSQDRSPSQSQQTFLQ